MTTLKATVEAFMQRLPEMNDPDEPLDGSDAVDVLGQFWPLFKATLKEEEKLAVKKRTNSASPTYQDLVETLGTAIAEWSYLFPEKFDDVQHARASRANLKRAERIFKQALNVLANARTLRRPPHRQRRPNTMATPGNTRYRCTECGYTDSKGKFHVTAPLLAAEYHCPKPTCRALAERVVGPTRRPGAPPTPTKKGVMETTFSNVTITVSAANPTEAYDRLCNILADPHATDGDLEFITDTFTTDDDPCDRDTSELWPKNEPEEERTNQGGHHGEETTTIIPADLHR